jgi:CotS family spore coat protein
LRNLKAILITLNLWKASYGVGLMEELRKIVKNYYGLEVLNIEKVKNAYKIKTPHGDKCFKASKYDFKQFDFIINAILHLIENGYENVVAIDPTLEGKNYIKCDKGFGFLCDWIDSREASFENPIELKMCIEALSRLHLASMGFKYKINSSIRNQYGKWISRFKKRCDELLYFKAILSEKRKHSEFDSMYLKYFENHYKQALKAISDLQGSEYVKISEKHLSYAGFCHHDTANHNFLITSELKIYLIDFDYCIFDTYIHDLGSIIIRNLKYGNWNLDKMEDILEIYNENIEISKDELYLLFCFMEFPQDFWQVGLQYYVENQSWDEEIFLKKLNRIVNDSKNRFEFLKYFKGSELLGRNK